MLNCKQETLWTARSIYSVLSKEEIEDTDSLRRENVLTGRITGF